MVSKNNIIILIQTKPQKAMGHSTENVSFTYLRGLEDPEVPEENGPKI